MINLVRKTNSAVENSTYRTTDEVAYFSYNIVDGSDVIGVSGKVGNLIQFGFIDSTISSSDISKILRGIGAFFSIDVIRITVVNNPDLDIKLNEICENEGDDHLFATEVVNSNMESTLLNNAKFGHVVASDYRMTINDDILGVVTTYGDVTILIPDISFLGTDVIGNPFWRIYKMTGDKNRVKIILEDSTQSLVKYSMRYLTMIGMAVEVGMYKAFKKYWFTDVSTQASYVRASFVNLTPSISDGQLTMRGYVEDLANNESIMCYFKYREKEGDTWLSTDPVIKTSLGLTEATVPIAYESCQTQMIVEDYVGGVFYSTILLAQDIKPYYPDVESAMSDGVIRLWGLQEHSSIDETGVDVIDGDDMKFFGGVTFGSDTIGEETIYKRIFSGSGYGESSIKIKKGKPYTIALVVDMNTISGDHTIFSTGKNITSLASDGNDVQLEVNGSVYSWNDVLPFSGFKILFITIDPSADKTFLYDVTGSQASLVISIHDVIKKKGIFIRLGKGSSGDANHQDNEYMSDGAVRTVVIWDEVISPIVMTDIATNLENGGLLINVQ